MDLSLFGQELPSLHNPYMVLLHFAITAFGLDLGPS